MPCHITIAEDMTMFQDKIGEATCSDKLVEHLEEFNLECHISDVEWSMATWIHMVVLLPLGSSAGHTGEASPSAAMSIDTYGNTGTEDASLHHEFVIHRFIGAEEHLQLST